MKWLRSLWWRFCLWGAFGDAWALTTIAAYRQAFPNNCPLCGYDRWGVSMGHTLPWPKVRHWRPCVFTCVEGVCHHEGVLHP